MKIILIIIGFSFLNACSTKAKEKWDGQSFKADCMNKLTDAGYVDSIIERKDFYKICDCMTAAVVDKYETEEKSIEAAEKNSEEFTALFQSCTDQLKATLGK